MWGFFLDVHVMKQFLQDVLGFTDPFGDRWRAYLMWLLGHWALVMVLAEHVCMRLLYVGFPALTSPHLRVVVHLCVVIHALGMLLGCTTLLAALLVAISIFLFYPSRSCFRLTGKQLASLEGAALMWIPKFLLWIYQWLVVLVKIWRLLPLLMIFIRPR